MCLLLIFWEQDKHAQRVKYTEDIFAQRHLFTIKNMKQKIN